MSNVQISYGGAIADDATAEAQRDSIRTAWALRAGQPFTQQAWDEAKTTALRSLTAKRFPTGNIEISRAEVDADRHEARLSVTYQSGPAYKFGPLVLNGIKRYDPDGARRIARLPSGQDYDQQKLLDAQQRLASSGYYDSVFLTLDTDSGNPLAAPVIAQLREAPLQKVVLGAGFTTDNGPRLSVDHIHNQVPLLGWRAVSRLSVDSDIKSLGTELNAIPDDHAGAGSRAPSSRASNRAATWSTAAGCAAGATSRATTSTAATSCSTTTRRTAASTRRPRPRP